MTSIVQQNCQIIEQVNRENLGTRLGYFGSEYKMAEQSFHSFHEEEIRELLTKNQGSKLTHTNSQNANDFDNLRVTKISTNKRLRVRIIHVSQTFGGSRSNARRNVQTTCETNKTAESVEVRKAPFLLATGQRYCTEALCHTCACECCCCCSSWFSLHMSKINSFFKRP